MNSENNNNKENQDSNNIEDSPEEEEDKKEVSNDMNEKDKENENLISTTTEKNDNDDNNNKEKFQLPEKENINIIISENEIKKEEKQKIKQVTTNSSDDDYYLAYMTTHRRLEDRKKYIKDQLILKETSFSEKINFYNHFSLIQNFEPNNSDLFYSKRNLIRNIINNTINNNIYVADESKYFIKPFPFLLSQEFFFGPSTPIETDKYLNSSLSPLSKNEMKKIIMTRIKTFSDFDYDKKFMENFISNLPFYMRNIELEDVEKYLIPSLSKIVEEPNDLQIIFLKTNEEIINYLYNQGDNGYKIISGNILSIINEIYDENKDIKGNIEMRTLLYKNIVKICKCLKEKDLENSILVKIISLSLDSVTKLDYENLTFIINIIGEICSDFNANCNENFILPQLLMISQMKNEDIKINICSILPKISRYISFDCINTKVNRIIEQFTNEKEGERLKIKIVDILCDMMNIFHEKSLYDINLKNTFYIKNYKLLLYNKNKNIHLHAFKSIGKFINFLSLDELDNTYIEYFSSLLNEYYDLKENFHLSVDRSILFPSAYNFPAIIYRYGPQSWDILKTLYAKLAAEKDEKISLSLINSFCEMSKLIGEEQTENDLLVLYDNFLNNNNPEISKKAIYELTNTLKNLSIKNKKRYLIYYKKNFGIENLNNYNGINMNNLSYERYEEKIRECEIIDCFFNIFDDEIIYRRLVPVLISMCVDENAHVRKKCSKIFGRIILYLKKKNHISYKGKIEKIIQSFSYNVYYKMRALFCKLCEVILLNEELYKTLLKEALLILSYDKIINVRVALAKLCYNIINNKNNINISYILFDEDFLKIAYRLLNDEQKTIREILSNNNTENKIITKLNSINCDTDSITIREFNKFYYKFNNNMEIVINEFDLNIPSNIKNYKKVGKEDYIKTFY